MANNNNNTLGNFINSKNYNRSQHIAMMYRELERDIYDEHTLKVKNLTLSIPQINTGLVIMHILKKHNYVLDEINNMTFSEIEECLQKHPGYIVSRIHDSYVIEAAIYDALIATTNNNIFYDIEYIYGHFNNPIWKQLYQKYYTAVYEPIIQKLYQFSEAYLQFALLKRSMY